MAGPILIEEAIMPRRITEIGKHSNPVYRSFIASFGVDLILRILNFYIMSTIVEYTFSQMHMLGHKTSLNRLPFSSPSVQFSSVTQSCPTLCKPMNFSTSGLPVHHQLPEFTQTHAHWVCDAIQPSQPLSSPSLPAPNPSQNQSLFQWVNSSHEVAKILGFQPQHQSFQ